MPTKKKHFDKLSVRNTNQSLSLSKRAEMNEQTEKQSKTKKKRVSQKRKSDGTGKKEEDSKYVQDMFPQSYSIGPHRWAWLAF